MNRETEEEPVARLREELNSRYDAYTEQYGTVTPRRQNNWLTEDLEYPNVAALETLTSVEVEKTFTDGPRKGEKHILQKSRIDKADIFSRRTIYPFIMPEQAYSLEDTVKISRVYRHSVDVPYIARLTGTTVENTRAELVASGLAFINPVTGLAEARDVYLTGDVRTKLRETEANAEENTEYQQNVSALQEVQPARKTIDQIGFRLGTSWLPEESVRAFLENVGVRNQVLRGNVAEDTFDNPFDEVQATFEDMLAAFSGNPLAKEKMKLQAEIRRLQSLKSAHGSRLAGMRSKLRMDTSRLEQTHKALVNAQKAKAHLESCSPDEKIPDRKETAQKIGIWLEQTGNTIKDQLKNVKSLAQWQICNPREYVHTMGMALPGDLKLEITAYATADQKDNEFMDNEFTKEVVTAFELRGPFGIKNSSVFSGATGLFTRIENALDNEKNRPERILQEQEQIKANILSLEHELEEPFPHEQAYEAAQARWQRLKKLWLRL